MDHQLLFDMWRFTICKWELVVTGFLGELDHMRIRVILTCSYKSVNCKSGSHSSSTSWVKNNISGMYWHIYVVCQKSMLNIGLIIQISMSVVSDFTILIITVTVFSVELQFGKMPPCIFVWRECKFLWYWAKILWDIQKHQTNLCENCTGIADCTAESMQQKFHEEKNCKHRAKWRNCGFLEAIVISPSVPTFLRYVVVPLILVWCIPLFVIAPHSISWIPVIVIVGPIVVSGGRGILNINVFVWRRSPS